MSQPQLTLEQLSERAAAANPAMANRYKAKHMGKGCADGGCGFWVWFLVLAVIIAFILAVAKPHWIRNCNDDEENRRGEGREDCDNFFRDINWGKLILWSLVIAAVICFVLYLLKCSGCFAGCFDAVCGY